MTPLQRLALGSIAVGSALLGLALILFAVLCPTWPWNRGNYAD